MKVILEKKSIKNSSDIMTAEFGSNEAKIKIQLNEMQTKLDILMMKVYWGSRKSD